MRNFAGVDSLGVTALRPGKFLKLLNATQP